MTDLGLAKDIRAMRPALVVVALACLTMVVASVYFWPQMAETLVTRAANDRHGDSVVQRWFAVAAFPLFLLLFSILLTATPALDRKLRRLFSPPNHIDSRNNARVLGFFLAGIAVAMTISHFGLLSAFAGISFPLEKAMAASLGLILILLGIAFPLARPEDEALPSFLRRFQEAVGPVYRPAAIVLVLIGLASIALAFASAGTALLLACLCLVVLVLGMIVAGLVRMRGQQNS